MTLRQFLPLPIPMLLSVVLLGCGPKKTDNRPAYDGDANSGPDGKRSGAVKMDLNKVTLPDDVNYDKQDMTDWRSIELKGKPGLLNVELHWDNDKSDMSVDAYDAVGTQMASSPGPQPGATSKKIVAQIDALGTYYLRVTAPKAHDGSVYTLEAKWEVDEAPAAVEAPPPVEKPKKEPRREPKGPSTPRVRAPKEFAPENGVQGRIVSSYREGTSMVLHIDKGTAAGVKEGQVGAVLDGPTGANALPGGDFKITTVVDEHKCIAKTGLRSIGKNNRVSINNR
ncbi:MAG: hypothetical protein EXR72_08210 [Myxococcales bacterium]|nr:hypothetical protein [Myxococcales bacterium]